MRAKRPRSVSGSGKQCLHAVTAPALLLALQGAATQTKLWHSIAQSAKFDRLLIGFLDDLREVVGQLIAASTLAFRRAAMHLAVFYVCQNAV